MLTPWVLLLLVFLTMLQTCLRNFLQSSAYDWLGRRSSASIDRLLHVACATRVADASSLQTFMLADPTFGRLHACLPERQVYL